MTQQAKAAAVIYAKNRPRLSDFYVAVAGFEIADCRPDHVVLESPLLQLVVQSIPQAIADSIEIENPPLRRANAPIKLVFFVPDIAACRRIAPTLGGELNDATREWQFKDHIVCDGHDPEGNVLQFRQPM